MSRPRQDWPGGDVPNLPLWPLQSAINIPVHQNAGLSLVRSFSLYLTHSLSLPVVPLPPSHPPTLPPSLLERLYLSL
jgi:hypothetical protein